MTWLRTVTLGLLVATVLCAAAGSAVAHDGDDERTSKARAVADVAKEQYRVAADGRVQLVKAGLERVSRACARHAVTPESVLNELTVEGRDPDAALERLLRATVLWRVLPSNLDERELVSFGLASEQEVDVIGAVRLIRRESRPEVVLATAQALSRTQLPLLRVWSGFLVAQALALGADRPACTRLLSNLLRDGDPNVALTVGAEIGITLPLEGTLKSIVQRSTDQRVAGTRREVSFSQSNGQAIGAYLIGALTRTALSRRATLDPAASTLLAREGDPFDARVAALRDVIKRVPTLEPSSAAWQRVTGRVIPMVVGDRTTIATELGPITITLHEFEEHPLREGRMPTCSAQLSVEMDWSGHESLTVGSPTHADFYTLRRTWMNQRGNETPLATTEGVVVDAGLFPTHTDTVRIGLTIWIRN